MQIVNLVVGKISKWCIHYSASSALCYNTYGVMFYYKNIWDILFILFYSFIHLFTFLSFF